MPTTLQKQYIVTTTPTGDYTPTYTAGSGDKSLLYLSPSGPSVPVLSRISEDIGHMMHNILRPPLAPSGHPVFRHPPPKPVFHPTNFISEEEEPFMSRMGFVINKLMGAHYGDRSFDIFDWIPLIAILVAGGLLVGGLFPNGISTFGLNGGNLVLNGRRREDRLHEPDSLEYALEQLESGALMVSALTREDGCSARLACRLGDLAREKFEDRADLIIGAMDSVLPKRFANFSRSFQDVFHDSDRSSCNQECYRCISVP